MDGRKSNQRELREFIANQTGRLENPLSLVHTTDMRTLDRIEQTDRLEAQKQDKYFKSKLLYFFYGRPSFCVHPLVKNTAATAFAPVCLVFRNEFRSTPERIYPFDTGAFLNGRMNGVIHDSLKLEDFELDIDPQTPSALVRAFYRTNRNYMDCKPDHSSDYWEEVSNRRLHRVEAYLDLLRIFPNDKSDERLHSIEIQSKQIVTIKDNLLAVVVPARLFPEVERKRLEQKWNCEVVMYHLKFIFSPTNLMELVFDKVREILVQNEQIS